MNKNLYKTLVITLLAVTSVFFTACSGGSGKTVVIGQESVEEDTVVEEANEEGYYFTYNNIKIRPNDLAAPIIKALGDDYQYFESPSCAYIGMDKCYTYSNFTIYTYGEADGTDHILQLVFNNDLIKTDEGIMVGDTAEKVLETYGNDYIESNGSYAYVKGTSQLIFITKNDRVSSIQYYYKEN
ncbi:MAG: hypothetical protein K6B75_07890 [Lachnospiraceae bacterium]|nr:hypothetical protein [Lachnospiraceae bacterium]